MLIFLPPFAYLSPRLTYRARKAFERAVLIDSKLSPARTFLGLISKDAGELREAVQIFDTVLAENEDDQVARLNRGVCMRDLGLPARALYDFDTVIEREPDFSMAYRERGQSQSN